MEESMNHSSISIPERSDNFSLLRAQSEPFGDSCYWEIPNLDYFPEDVIRFFREIRPTMIEFIKGGYSRAFCEVHMQKFRFFRKLALNLAKSGNIVDAYLNTNSWGGKKGLKIAQVFFLQEVRTLKSFPTTESQIQKSKVMRYINKALQREAWKISFEIANWDDFLRSIYGENFIDIANLLSKFSSEGLLTHFPFYEEKPSFLRKRYFFDFVKELLSKNSPDLIRGLFLIMQSGYFEGVGLTSWHNFLSYCFNQERFEKYRLFISFAWNSAFNLLFIDLSHLPCIRFRFESRKGLEIILRDLRAFPEDFGRFPTQIDFPIAMEMLTTKSWEKFGINTWEALIGIVYKNTNGENKNDE